VSSRVRTVRGIRRSLAGLALALAAIGIFTGGLAYILESPTPLPGASREAQLYYRFCVTCHGVDGRGSWRAALFLLRPRDLTDPTVRAHSDQYLFDIIKSGGAPVGRPGMPAFGSTLEDADIAALVRYLRQLPATPPRSG
jgi:mono/diheme cytochrome c family protein